MNKKIIKESPFGSVGMIWSEFEGDPRIVQVLLSRPGLSAEFRASQLFPHSRLKSCAEIDAVAGAVRRLLKGDDVEIPLKVAALEKCSAFQQSVLRAEYAIPRGRVSSYRLLAAYLGKENSARAVGNALAKNPFPLIVPCHRAIRSDGRLGGYQGGFQMKRALLEKEGIAFDDSGRVICEHYYYERE